MPRRAGRPAKWRYRRGGGAASPGRSHFLASRRLIRADARAGSGGAPQRGGARSGAQEAHNPSGRAAAEHATARRRERRRSTRVTARSRNATHPRVSVQKMATLALAVAGAAAGGALLPTGVTVLGATLGGAAIGAQVGAVAGSFVDQALFGASG